MFWGKTSEDGKTADAMQAEIVKIQQPRPTSEDIFDAIYRGRIACNSKIRIRHPQLIIAFRHPILGLFIFYR